MTVDQWLGVFLLVGAALVALSELRLFMIAHNIVGILFRVR